MVKLSVGIIAKHLQFVLKLKIQMNVPIQMCSIVCFLDAIVTPVGGSVGQSVMFSDFLAYSASVSNFLLYLPILLYLTT